MSLECPNECCMNQMRCTFSPYQSWPKIVCGLYMLVIIKFQILLLLLVLSLNFNIWSKTYLYFGNSLNLFCIHKELKGLSE